MVKGLSHVGGTELVESKHGVGVLGAELQHRQPALKALTSLRFFAAMHVVLYHMMTNGAYAGVPLLHNFVASGYTGIFLFFILSGFILAYNYREVPDRTVFWISRLARIYPVYLLALLAGFLFVVAPASPPISHVGLRLVVSATLLQAWYKPFVDSFNPPGWTLSVEAFFYLLFPFLLPWVRRAGWVVCLLFFAVYLVVFCSPAMLHGWDASSRLPFETAHSLVRGTLPLLHLPLFITGMYLGSGFLKRTSELSGNKWLLPASAITSGLLLCFACPEIYLPIQTFLLIIAYAALIDGLAAVQTGWLTSRWMVAGGEISFSIYILQMPVMRAVLAVTRRLGLGYYGGVAAVVVTLVAVSFAAYRYVELPARVAIRRYLTRTPVVLREI